MRAIASFLTLILLLTPLTGLVSGTGARSSACNGDVCISELMPNPSGDDTGNFPAGEWVELHNNGSSGVDLQGWTLEDLGGWAHPINADTWVGFANLTTPYVLPAGDYAVISEAIQGSLKLNNAGETLYLKNPTGTIIHTVTTGSALVNISKVPGTTATGDYVDSTGNTPGSANSGASSGPTYFESDLQITEIMPNTWPRSDNGTWPAGEWVEIWNNGSDVINISGWKITDAVGNILPFDKDHIIGNDSLMLAGEYRIIALNGSTQWGILNNGQETVKLVMPNGSFVQSLFWYDTVAGFTLMPHADGTIGLSSYPTPGMENPRPLYSLINSSSDVKFTEVMPNASDDGQAFPTGEWIEMHNNGSSDINLSGWKIIDGMGNETTLDENSLVTNSSQSATMINAGERRLVQFDQETRLWDEFNHVILFNNTGDIVDLAWWNSDFGENISLIRDSDINRTWAPSSTPTPGQPEPTGDTTAIDFYINEIMPSPIGTDSAAYPAGEWIEVVNNGTTFVDIKDFRFTSGASARVLIITPERMPLQANTYVAPGDIALIATNGSSSFYMKNELSDGIELVDDDGNILDWATWDAPTEGESLVDNSGTWSNSMWPTPGEENPNFTPYNGPTNITINEAGTDGEGPFIELLNTGNQIIDLSAWLLKCMADGSINDSDYIWTGALRNSITASFSAGEYAVVNGIINNDCDQLILEDPDGMVVHSLTFSADINVTTILTTGQSMGAYASQDWLILPYPTAGAHNPTASAFAGPEDLLFTMVSPAEDLISIKNTASKTAFLLDWSITTTTQAMVETSITLDNSLASGEMITLSLVLDDDSMAISLQESSGMEADSVVYGNGPTSIGGWQGVTISPPAENLGDLVYLRGDGCNHLPDSNSSVDWKLRWSLAGASHFCDDTSFSGMIDFTPLIGPESGLVDVIDWLDSATTSLDIALYQLHHPVLTERIIAAHQRGIDVEVLLQYPTFYWDWYQEETTFGYHALLVEGGVNVRWFGHPDSQSPYAMMHSKVAVKDNSSIWIGSGNWKSSTLPAPDQGGNREWGAFINSSDLADSIQLRFDYDFSVGTTTSGDTPNGWVPGSSTSPSGPVTSSMQAQVNGELLTCPDDCIQTLAEMINSADEEILLSLQYLELDWYWGWQANPLLDSLLAAAQRGVSIRLIMNAHYLDENPDVRDSVEELNENWSAKYGYDVQAIMMTENDDIIKLHNKGAIIDGESVLISSINWGDNSILRNREMGVLIHSEEATAPYLASWWLDWNRTDDTTDSDGDGMPDWWEVANGLNRSRRSMPLGLTEAELDPDGDGKTNLQEFLADTDPWSNDNVNDNNNNTDNNGNNTIGDDNTPTTTDADGDLIEDSLDECLGTPTGVATDSNGCSAEQLKESAKDSTQSQTESSGGMDFMLMLVGVGGFVFITALALLLLRKKEEDFVYSELEMEMDKSFDQPVLDATPPMTTETTSFQMPVLDGTSKSPPDMSLYPGWDEATVLDLIEQGWTGDQLTTYYAEQMSDHQQQTYKVQALSIT